MHEPVRVDSPGPTLSVGSIAGLENPESVKLSFRAGGEKVFYEKLKGSLTQRKWLLHLHHPRLVAGTREGLAMDKQGTAQYECGLRV